MGRRESKQGDPPSTKEEGQALADVIGHLSLLGRDGQVRVIRSCAAFFGIMVSFHRDSGPPRRVARTRPRQGGQQAWTDQDHARMIRNAAFDTDTVLCDGCSTRHLAASIVSTWCERLAACLLCTVCVINENGRRLHDYPDPKPGDSEGQRTCRACGNVRQFGDAPEAGCRGTMKPTVDTVPHPRDGGRYAEAVRLSFAEADQRVAEHRAKERTGDGGALSDLMTAKASAPPVSDAEIAAHLNDLRAQNAAEFNAEAERGSMFGGGGIPARGEHAEPSDADGPHDRPQTCLLDLAESGHGVVSLPKPEDMHGAADGFGGTDVGSHYDTVRQAMIESDNAKSDAESGGL